MRTTTVFEDGSVRVDEDGKTTIFMSVDAFCETWAFTPDTYPAEDCDAANDALRILASDPKNERYLQINGFGEPLCDGRDLCDRANDSI